MARPLGAETVRFSVVSFAPAGVRLAVVGSCPELGDWRVERAHVMQCRLGDKRLQSEPDYHWVDVALPVDACSLQPAMQYKFLELDHSGARWEELPGNGNRELRLDGERAGEVLLLPVERFAESKGGESDHTARFYEGVKTRGEISVRRVLGQLFVGSCPRQMRHLDYLKSLGITVIVNFQTEEDCKRNSVAGIGMEEDPLALSREYEARGMEYVWLPTFDMSTDGRAQMLPQASHLFASLLRRGHVLYSHCNAGVGRSVAAACGYLVFALGLSLRQTQHVVASARPVAYFDFEALARARPRHEALFGRPPEDAGDKARREEALSSIAGF